MIPLPRLLDSNLNEVRRLNPISLSIYENIIPLSTASMRLKKEDSVQGRSYVELFTINGSAGIYRTKTPDIKYDSQLSDVTLEHGICEIGDWIISTEIYESIMSVSDALELVFDYYRGDKWQLGNVASNDNIICNFRPGNLLEAILNIINQIPNYMLNYDFTTSPWTLNVVHKGTTVATEGRLSRNIQSATIKRDDSKLCTRVYLEGLPTLGDAIGHLDASTISTYGVIETVLPSGDYTQAEAFLVATNHLNRYKSPIFTVTINGVDLSNITGESLDQVRLGKLYRLTIPEDDVVLEETITEIRWENVYDRPGVFYITLSEDLEGAVQFYHEQSKETTANSAISDKRSKETNEAINTLEFYVGDADDIMEQMGLSLDEQSKLVYSENETEDDNFIASLMVQNKRVLTGKMNVSFSANTWFTGSIMFNSPLDTTDYMVVVCRDEEDQSISTHVTGFSYEISSKTTSGFTISLYATNNVTANVRWMLIGKKGVVINAAS